MRSRGRDDGIQRAHGGQERFLSPTIPTDADVRNGHVELYLREIGQLFESLDPSPFREKDLDRRAEEYIVDSVRELPSKAPCELVIRLEQPANQPDEERVAGAAIRTHFARRSHFLRRDVHRLLRRGFLSFGIGLAFLGLLFATAQFTGLTRAETGFATLVRESMLILGWVAMWRPLEIFLYDWWPIVGEQRLHDRLSRINVQVVRDRGSDEHREGERPRDGG